MSEDPAVSRRGWAERALLAAFFVELVNLYSITVTQGTLQLFALSDSRFQSFHYHALLAWIFLASWEWLRRPLTDDRTRHYRIARLVIVALCLVGVSIFFRHGIRLGADGPNYFIQARSLLFDGDIDYRNELERVPGVVPEMPERSMGLPLYSMPFLVLAHLLTKTGAALGHDLVADGFGYPYETAFGLASFVIGSLGLIAMLKAAFEFFSRGVALLSVVTVGSGSFLAWYMVAEPAMPHAVSAATVAFLVCFWLTRRPLTERRDWILMGVLCAIASLTRWQNIVFIALPLLDAFMKPRRSGLKPLWAAVAFAVTFIPQLAYWYAMAGSPFAVSMERHQVIWSQLGAAEVLFSTNRGLFPWSPVLYLGSFGLLIWLKSSKRLAALCLLGFAMQIYINGSVEMWWGGWAYGGRRFDNCLVFFVIGFAALIDFMRRRPMVLAALLCASLVMWNAGLMLQLKNAQIAPDRNVSFEQATVRTLRFYYERLGFPAAWPANWLFARRYDVSPEKFDRLFGHQGFGNLRLPMDPASDAFMGRGWSDAERARRGDWFRWSLGKASSVLVPLREPHHYRLSAWVRPYEHASPNHVGLRVNGSIEPGYRLDGETTLVWEIAPHRLRVGINELRFEFADSVRPSDVTASTDSRNLAVRFYRLELIAYGVTHEPAPNP